MQCTVVSDTLVEPPVSGTACRMAPALIRRINERSIDMAPQILMGRCFFGKSGYVTKE